MDLFKLFIYLNKEQCFSNSVHGLLIRENSDAFENGKQVR